MPTLRKMIDNGSLAAASPMATHVAKNVQDPLGETKEGFEDLAQKKSDYEVAKEGMRRNLLPVRSVIDHVNQMHQLDGVPNPNDPMDPDNPDLEQGMMPPNNMQQSPGQMGPSAGKPGMMSPSQPGTGPRLTPQKPMVPGAVPGKAAGPQESVRPPKMGMPKPGQARPGTAAGNPSAKPKAAGKQQSKVEVKVHATGKMPRRGSMEAGMALISLRSEGNRKKV